MNIPFTIVSSCSCSPRYDYHIILLSHCTVCFQLTVIRVTNKLQQSPTNNHHKPGNVLTLWQDKLSRAGGTMEYSRERIALGVLNIVSGPHEVSWHQVRHGQGNLLLITTCLCWYIYTPPRWTTSGESTEDGKDAECILVRGLQYPSPRLAQ